MEDLNPSENNFNSRLHAHSVEQTSFEEVIGEAIEDGICLQLNDHSLNEKVGMLVAEQNCSRRSVTSSSLRSDDSDKGCVSVSV